MIGGKEIDYLKNQFEVMDVDHTGLIDAEELMLAIKNAGFDLQKEEVEKMIESINFKGNG